MIFSDKDRMAMRSDVDLTVVFKGCEVIISLQWN